MHSDERVRREMAAEEATALVSGYRGRAVRVQGGAGSGKSHVLVERASALAREGGRVLYMAAASARQPTTDAIARSDAPSSPLVRVITWHGLARSVAASVHPERRFLGSVAQREVIASLVGHDIGSLVVERTTSAIDALRSSWLGREEILTHADALGVALRWEQLCDVADDYEHHLSTYDLTDRVGSLITATVALRDPSARVRLGYDHVIADDFESATFSEHRLLTTIASPTDGAVGSVTVAGDPDGPAWDGAWGARWLAGADRHFDVGLDVVLQPRPAPRGFEAVRVHHRSVLGEAIVGEVMRCLDEGCRADEVAIVVGSSAVESAVAAAARRHGLPVASSRRRCGDDPVVAAAAAALLADPDGAWPTTCEALGLTASWRAALGGRRLSEIAFGAWTVIAPRLADDGFGHLGDAGTHPATAALRTFIDALAERESSAGPIEASVAVRGALEARVAPRTGVALTDDAGTRGRRWRRVIVTGCEEGVRPPRPEGSIPALDPELLDGPDVPGIAERHRRSITEARRRYEFVLTRAHEAVVAVAAPEPGVLLSRFLEVGDAGPRAPHLPAVQRRPLRPVAASVNDRPLWEGPIRASASSLETYMNCPLQFTYRYVLGIDTPSGVQAAVGTLVHAILERFLDPATGALRTRERLAELIDEEWRDDLFTYRAQAAEYRSRVNTMLLSTWFDREAAAATDVVKVEHRFRIMVAGHVLSGFIDRVDRHHGRDGRAELEVIDYKTGSWKSLRAGEESLQLGTYYLAAKRDPELAALGEPTRLRLHFVAAGKDAWQTVTTNHEALWEQVIAGVLADIEMQHHEPSDEADCEYCDFQRLCPNQPQGRVVPLAPPTRLSTSGRPR